MDVPGAAWGRIEAARDGVGGEKWAARWARWGAERGLPDGRDGVTRGGARGYPKGSLGRRDEGEEVSDFEELEPWGQGICWAAVDMVGGRGFEPPTTGV